VRADHPADLALEPDEAAAVADGAPLDRPDPGERDLLEQLLAGDEAAFESLVARHHGPMLRVARIFLSKPDVAEEVVQETWLVVLRGLAGFEGRSSLKTWIFRILANRARTRAARDARVVPFAELASTEDDDGVEAVLERRFTADGRWQDPPLDWQVHSPEALVLRREAMDHLGHALEQLPPAQRTVVTLRDVEGWTALEVCAALQITEANQRVLLHRARTRLRRALEEALGPR
jgi:RNA polymerase sigma-70 factor (ECF subfamily)